MITKVSQALQLLLPVCLQDAHLNRVTAVAKASAIGGAVAVGGQNWGGLKPQRQGGVSDVCHVWGHQGGGGQLALQYTALASVWWAS